MTIMVSLPFCAFVDFEIVCYIHVNKLSLTLTLLVLRRPRSDAPKFLTKSAYHSHDKVMSTDLANSDHEL